MPMELLHQIANKEFPLIVTDIASIDKLRVLHAAGHVTVYLPEIDAKEPRARVLGITDKGRAALRNFDPLGQ